MEVELNESLSVQFIADDGAPEISKSPFSLPSKLGRKELNEVLNHLLQKTDALTFDFQIAGDLLRSSLAKFLERRGISSENVLVVHYFISNPTPEDDLILEHPDWVSDLRLFGKDSMITTCYDGTISVWNGNDLKAQSKGHNAPIKAVDHIESAGDAHRFATGGQDQQVCIWDYSDSNLKCVKQIGVSQTVLSLSSSPTDPFLAVGTFDGSLSIHNTTANLGEPARKKRKVNEGAEDSPENASVTINIHSRPITSLKWVDKYAAYAGCWTSLHLVDPNQEKLVHRWPCPAPVNDIAFSFEQNLLLSAHSDKVVRIYDSRTSHSQQVLKSCRSHLLPVSSISFGPSSGHEYVTTSLDGGVKV
jgi:ribosome biogenesis protein YTM1